MRDIAFLVADLSMHEALRGFLTRNDFHRGYNLGIRPFEFDPRQDLFYAAGLVWSLVGGAIFLGYSAGAGFNLRGELARIRRGADEDEPPSAG